MAPDVGCVLCVDAALTSKPAHTIQSVESHAALECVDSETSSPNLETERLLCIPGETNKGALHDGWPCPLPSFLRLPASDLILYGHQVPSSSRFYVEGGKTQG